MDLETQARTIAEQAIYRGWDVFEITDAILSAFRQIQAEALEEAAVELPMPGHFYVRQWLRARASSLKDNIKGDKL